MTYNQAKAFTIVTGILVVIAINTFAAYYNSIPETGALIATSIIAIFPGALLGLIAWGIGRISYVEGMLNKTTLSDKQVATIWRFSCRYSVGKDIGFQDFLEKVDKLVSEVSDRVRADGVDVYSVAMACMCIHYSNLWKGNWCGGDSGIKRLLSNFHDPMKMVDHYKSST